jgi:hypothetical protein
MKEKTDSKDVLLSAIGGDFESVIVIGVREKTFSFLHNMDSTISFVGALEMTKYSLYQLRQEDGEKEGSDNG